MQFGPRVKELRAIAGMTQKQLADQLGVSVSYICKVETERLHFGERVPAEALGSRDATGGERPEVRRSIDGSVKLNFFVDFAILNSLYRQIARFWFATSSS